MKFKMQYRTSTAEYIKWKKDLVSLKTGLLKTYKGEKMKSVYPNFETALKVQIEGYRDTSGVWMPKRWRCYF